MPEEEKSLSYFIARSFPWKCARKIIIKKSLKGLCHEDIAVFLGQFCAEVLA